MGRTGREAIFDRPIPEKPHRASRPNPVCRMSRPLFDYFRTFPRYARPFCRKHRITLSHRKSSFLVLLYRPNPKTLRAIMVFFFSFSFFFLFPLPWNWKVNLEITANCINSYDSYDVIIFRNWHYYSKVVSIVFRRRRI